MIALFYNAFRNPNGTITITKHIETMFRAMGEEVRIYRMVTKPGKSKPLTTVGGPLAREVDVNAAIDIVNNYPSLMVHYMHDGSVNQEYAVRLVLETGLPFIIHDHRGLKPEMLDAARRSNARIVFIRDTLRKRFNEESDIHYDTIFLKHPYIRHEDVDVKMKYNAVSLGRVAREKKIEMVCQANALLLDRKMPRIMISGAETDRIYSHFTLDKFFPRWKDYRIKEPGTDQYALCCSTRNAVDMSEFKGDGGGTQYTFLEAMDAGSQLILNSKWLYHRGAEMRAGYNCWSVGTPAELAEIVSREPRPLEGYDDTLYAHSFKSVGDGWLDVCYER